MKTLSKQINLYFYSVIEQMVNNSEELNNQLRVNRIDILINVRIINANFELLETYS